MPRYFIKIKNIHLFNCERFFCQVIFLLNSVKTISGVKFPTGQRCNLIIPRDPRFINVLDFPTQTNIKVVVHNN